jgi:hypothetical protein
MSGVNPDSCKILQMILGCFRRFGPLRFRQSDTKKPTLRPVPSNQI